jgi:hypothetical protein
MEEEGPDEMEVAEKKVKKRKEEKKAAQSTSKINQQIKTIIKICFARRAK